MQDIEGMFINDLNISHNRLSSLGFEKMNCPNLASLNAQHNNLIHLGPELKKLKGLRTLLLGYNALGSLPDDLFYEHLLVLGLHHNAFQKFPEHIHKFPNLWELHMFRNPLTELPDTIGKFQKLRILRLGNTEIQRLPPAIQGLKLRHLYLEFTKLEKVEDGFQYLDQERLDMIHLRGTPLSRNPKECQKLVELFPHTRIKF